MKGFRLWLSALLALVLAGCNGSIKSPDFISELLAITVTPTAISGGTGQTQQLEATGFYSQQPGEKPGYTEVDLTDQVTWTSDNEGVVTVSPTGLATFGATIGTATITAAAHGKSATVAVNNGGVLLLSVVVTPTSAVVAPGGSATYTAQGLYSDSSVPRDMPVDETISWTFVGSSGGTINNGAAGKTVTVTSGATEGVYTVRATNTVQDIYGDAKFVVGHVTGIVVTPNPASSPVGRAVEFTAKATFATTTGGGVIDPQEVASIWSATANTGNVPTLDANCDTAAETRSKCLVTGRSAGQTVTVTASYQTFSGTATLNVTDAVLDKVVIESAPDAGVIINPTTRTASVGLGAAPSFATRYFYSDGVSGLQPRAPADKVTWTSSNAAIGALSVNADTNFATIATTAKGQTNLVAANAATSDTVRVVVGDATLSALIGVRPAKAYVAETREQEFTAVGRFSDNSTGDIPDSSVTWSTTNTTVSVPVGVNTGRYRAGTGQAGNAAVIRATLNSNTAQQATADFVVTSNRCSVPLRATDGAFVTTGPAVGIGLTGVANETNVIDIDESTFGTITTVLGALNAYNSINVFAVPNPAYTVPFAGGATPGFIITQPVGEVVLANILKQVEISTLDSNGNALETSSDLIPLRVDLLGQILIGGTPFEQVLVSLDTVVPFSGLRLRAKSGTATALANVNVFAACADSVPVAQVFNGIGSIYVEAPADGLPNRTTSVGSPVNFGALDLGGQPIGDLDVTWTSSDVGNPPTAYGVFTPDSPGDVTITATLKDQSQCVGNCSATYVLHVVQSFCESRLTGKVTHALSGLCLLCSVADEGNIADASNLTYGTLVLPVNLLGGITVDVKVASQSPSGDTVGFEVTTNASNVLLAGLAEQVVVRTYLGNTLQETSDSVLNPLNLDLLGVDADGFQYGTIGVVTSKPYDRVQLQFSSILTALSLSSVRVNSTCGSIVHPGD